MKKLTFFIASVCIAASAHSTPKDKTQKLAEAITPISITPLPKVQQAAKKQEMEDARSYTKDDSPLPITAIAATRIDLIKGKPIDQQFAAYARMAGWLLIWDAAEFALENNASIDGDFETAFSGFLKDTNESGSRLRATFYRGNKTVRVQEF